MTDPVQANDEDVYLGKSRLIPGKPWGMVEVRSGPCLL